MDDRKEDVARLAGVHVHEVQPVGTTAARERLARRLDGQVLDMLFNYAPPHFWSVGETIYLDDPLIGRVVPLERLDYHPDRGLYIRPEA